MCAIVVDMAVCMLWPRFCWCVYNVITVMVMLSAYKVSGSRAGSMSDVYMLKSVVIGHLLEGRQV